MKEILKGHIIDYETIKIRKNTPILDYLVKNNISFRLQHISKELYEQLQEFKYNSKKDIIDIPYDNFIAGYAPLQSAYNNLKAGGGLKLSDTSNDILGSFIIEEKRIVYNPLTTAFNEERDAYVYMYSPNEFYTTMTMPEILIELLKRKRKLLVCTGFEYKKKKGMFIKQEIDVFDEIDENEMIEYASNPEKGKKVLMKYISKL